MKRRIPPRSASPPVPKPPPRIPPLGLPPLTLSAMGSGPVFQLSAANYASRRVAGAPAQNRGPFFKVTVSARRSLKQAVRQGAGRPRRSEEFGEVVVPWRRRSGRNRSARRADVPYPRPLVPRGPSLRPSLCWRSASRGSAGRDGRGQAVLLFRVRGLGSAPVRIGCFDARLADRLLDRDPVAFGQARHLLRRAHHRHVIAGDLEQIVPLP
jgi:hypothetical protein